MNIVQVLLSPRIGGAESLVAGLQQHWNDSEVANSVIYVDSAATLSSSPLARLVRMRAALKHAKPDVIISHSALPNLYARLAASYSTPAISVLHSSEDDFVSLPLRWMERLLRKRTTALVAVSPAQRDRYMRRFPNHSRPVVIANGIAINARELSTRTRSDSPFHVVSLSRVVRQKNPRLWKAVAAQLGDQHFRFTWFGPGGYDRALDQMMKEEVPAGANYAGPTTHVADVLASAAIFFHSSNSEANSVSLLEAAAAGLPIVCSENVAATLPFYIGPVAFKTDSVESATEALLLVRDKYEALAERARAVGPRVQREFGIAECAAKYLELVGSVCSA